jgi:hypothetical protein
MATLQTVSLLHKNMPWMKFTQRMDLEEVLARCRYCNAQPIVINLNDADPGLIYSRMLQVHSACVVKWQDDDARGWRRHSMAKMLGGPIKGKVTTARIEDDIVRPKRAIELEDK